jgi:hypothetical protein
MAFEIDLLIPGVHVAGLIRLLIRQGRTLMCYEGGLEVYTLPREE